MATAPASIVVRHIRSLVASEGAGHLPDHVLLQRFTQEHEERAFAALVRRHGPLVLGVCRRVLHNWHDAEEAFQATFLVLARKAASIRKHESVGGWLHNVAYHAALKARAQAATRQLRERQSRVRSDCDSRATRYPDPLDELTGRELLAVMDEELQRLPERFRVPLVLCYLEGQTRDQAAQQLHCALRTLERRLEAGKKLLGSRLARRGVTLSAVGLATALTASAAAAALPATLVGATVKATMLALTGKAALGAAAALAQDVIRGMAIAKLKLVTAVLATIGIIGLGVGTITHRIIAERQPAIPATAAALKEQRKTDLRAVRAQKNPEPTVTPQPAKAEDTERMTVTGRVLDASGKPVAGAQVAVIGQPKTPTRGGDLSSGDNQVLDQTKANREGRFGLKVPRTSSARFRYVAVVAGSKGHGLGMQQVNPDAERPKAEIKLPPEQIIRGRILDLQGRPTAGVKVHVTAIGKSELGMPIPLSFWNAPKRFSPWPEAVTTDNEGRFVLHGLNRDQGVWLEVFDDRFARHSVRVPPEKEQKQVALTLAPAQIIEGRVLAEDTGNPVPHAHVTVTAWDNEELFQANGTGMDGDADAEGRFRLNPFPGKQFTVIAYASHGQPYLIRQKLFKWPKGAVKHAIEVRLPRGVLVRGKITEAKSGVPVAAASVQYLPRRNNPNQRDDIVIGWQATSVSNRDGIFHMAVIPGQGSLLIQGNPPDYVHLEIGSKQVDFDQPGGQRLYPDGLVVLDLKKEEKTKEVAVTLRRGVTIRGRLVGPDGKPVAKALMLSRINPQPHWHTSPLQVEVRDGRFELHGCDPEKTYPVYFLDPHNKLGATVQISGKQAGETVEVKLAPCGKAVARFVDTQDKPVANFNPLMEIVITPGPHSRDRDAYEKGLLLADSQYLANVDRVNYWAGPKADREGRITFAALIPGMTYRIVSHEKGGAVVKKDFTVKSGETVDLKDITIAQRE
ncbi:MAG TPA: sigma-70 family RNA polymerase sigma factor [Gemmataceae bacterium]|nr:sigma-70 family RNA polymerase sigma factor [Gemmataceae bacterium]